MARSIIIWIFVPSWRRLGTAPNWKGHSDTETLLYAVRSWGVERALQRFNGMFAFAIWDAQDKTLTLCRDRFGEKPLFYGWIGADLVFASELKAFVAHPGWQRDDRPRRANGIHAVFLRAGALDDLARNQKAQFGFEHYVFSRNRSGLSAATGDLLVDASARDRRTARPFDRSVGCHS